MPARADAATTIDPTTGPGAITNNPTPTFAFSSDDPLASFFECRIDEAAFETCPGNPYTTPALTDGPHSFEVRAVDQAGNPDPDPAKREFTVDTTPPDTTIETGPEAITDDSTPTFTFSSEDAAASFQCRVDTGEFGTCSGPGDTHTTPALTDGPHSFEVRAVDQAGNPDPDPAKREFTVDTTGPDTTIETGPEAITDDSTPTFTFSSEDAAASFQCRVDTGEFGACSGPGDTHTTPALTDGPHSFEVRAVDQAGNPDPDPAKREFTVDTTGPATTITKRPEVTINTERKSVRVAVSFSSEAGATYECKLDGARYEPCNSPYRVRASSKVGRGRQHTISVRATDAAGNVGGTESVSFTVVRERRLGAEAARRAVLTALSRHGFAHRVINAVRTDCRRRSRVAFECGFSARFPGYRLKGRGKVERHGSLSYRFRVEAQGVRFTLTDENEARRSS